MVVKGMLKKRNIEVLFADDGRQALEMFEQHHTELDIIFMDCEMPHMDGFQSTLGIRMYEQHHPLSRHPLIALTAHALGEFRQRGVDAGMDDFLTKPLQNEFLASSVALVRATKRSA